MVIIVVLAAAILAALGLNRLRRRPGRIVAAGDMKPGPAVGPLPPWDGKPEACPGASGYYTTELVTTFRRRPTEDERKALLGAPPLPNTTDLFPCPGDCVNVLTHVWHSWYLTKHSFLRRWDLHVCTFAQYRCTWPEDAAVHPPPVMGHPLDPNRPLMN